MASSTRGQDDSNRALRLATRADKMETLARSGLPAVSRKQNFPESHIINPLLTKFVRSSSRWLDNGLDFVSVHKHAKKNLVNNGNHLVPLHRLNVHVFNVC